jgi:glycosyltransferase involved in cell wall biosynthesis
VENPNRLLHFLSVRLERFLVKRADAVITVSEGIASEYAKRYGIPKPRLVLNCPPFQIVRKSDKFREKFAIGKDQTIFLYQGGLSQDRGIETLMEVFFRAVRKDIVLVVMGSGPLEGQVRETAERCGNIFFHPAVPSKELLPYTASADVGFLPYPNNCLNNYYCSPNKFFEYAMAGLPILVNDLAEMKRLVDAYRCGVVMASDTTEGIFAAVEKIMAEDLSVYSANARKLAERYNWEEQEKVLLSVYREVLSCAV